MRRGVLTIGNFDGVHVGHRHILQMVRSIADAEDIPAVAMTFEPPPERILHPQSPSKRILPHRRKVRRLLEGGVDYVVVVPTDEMLLSMAPDEFIDRVIVKSLHPRHIIEGENFFFGLARSGNVNTLRQAGDTQGFTVKVLDPSRIELSGEGLSRVSSTLIRRLIAEGRVADAAMCLKNEFALYGKVVKGAGQGRTLDFPTVNLDCGEQIIPADGVYAARASLAGSTFRAAVSIGDKPTLGPAPRTVEAFLIDAQGDFYDQEIELSFVRKLRDQAQFDSAEMLREQIAKDVERVREIIE